MHLTTSFWVCSELFMNRPYLRVILWVVLLRNLTLFLFLSSYNRIFPFFLLIVHLQCWHLVILFCYLCNFLRVSANCKRNSAKPIRFFGLTPFCWLTFWYKNHAFMNVNFMYKICAVSNFLFSCVRSNGLKICPLGAHHPCASCTLF